MVEPARRGELEREIRPMDMVCPQMGRPGSKSPNYWRSQCAARQTQRVCKCPVGRKVLEAAAGAAAKAARDRAARDAAAKQEEKAMPKKKNEKASGPCICCGKTGTYQGRGLIASCYWRHKRAGALEQFKPLGKTQAVVAGR